MKFHFMFFFLKKKTKLLFYNFFFSTEKTTAMFIEEAINKQHGILFAVPAIVGRNSYSGRNVIANNSEEKDKDERGYFQVEYGV